MRTRYKILIGLGLLTFAIYLFNASWLATEPENAEIKLIAHRGVAQNFSREDLTGSTCTAAQIFVPTHQYFENTIPSMRAAFAAGADIVEFDVQPTTDGTFAIFHDWTIDCRTEGTGDTRSHSMAYLKTLDIGYGYTADGGQTYPLRGKGVGIMPAIEDVMAAIPEGRFLVNFKSRNKLEGDMLAKMMADNPAWEKSVWAVYGSTAPTERAKELHSGLRGYSKKSVKDCLINYALVGWSGYVPKSCRNDFVLIPINLTPFIWGWPNRFQARMQKANSTVILIGPYTKGDRFTAGVDELELINSIPPGFDGYIWTNKIELVGPAIKIRSD